MSSGAVIILYNSLSSSKEIFEPISSNNVTMYVCGPTVYDVPHIGNLRSIIVYDVLYRILCTKYTKVTYVRNITDVDDKIIAAAISANKPSSEIAEYYTQIFHNNLSVMGCIPPTFEPKATENIDKMVAMINYLIEGGYAYIVNSNVYFDVSSCADYGKLSGRKLEEALVGSRIEIEEDKRHPNDFALWKGSEIECWDSPWGHGRPGWHIECSVMSTSYLGKNFDIHGGGLDLKFPHHDNEIAQSCCSYLNSYYAKYWVHNGFLTVNGEKMSKSIGNVLYVEDLLSSGISAETIRYTLLSSHYRKPINWTDSLVQSSQSSLHTLKRCLKFCGDSDDGEVKELYNKFLEIIYNDLNTPLAFSFLHQLSSEIDYINEKNIRNIILANAISKSLYLLGFSDSLTSLNASTIEEIENLIAKRKVAKQVKDFILADEIRGKLLLMHIKLHDNKDGSTSWETLL